MDVGVRELKAKLSYYLALAAEGERIVVTDRGRPYVELGPLPHESALDRGIEEGWIEAARAELGEAPLLRSRHTTAEVLDDDRGD